MMKVYKWEPYSTKTVTIVNINTTFGNIVFTAYQNSANETSHYHCFWNLSHNQNKFYNMSLFNPVLIFKIA